MMNFFKEIAENKELQKRLYQTKEVSDVATISKELGFNVSSVEILKAQAGRLIELATHLPEEAKLAMSGQKPNMGAQWGREGKGFLEQAGYWFIELHGWGAGIQSLNADLMRLFIQIGKEDSLKSKVMVCKTIDDLSKVAKENGFEVSPTTLLVYQALTILSLDDKKAELVAQGKIK